jgi:AraC family transcriptional regulator
MERVLDFIDANLDQDLSVERLSAVAAFSKYHFHRQFSNLLGISISRYLQLARLKRASYRLAFRRESVLQIALQSGYDGPEAFSRVFKQRLQQTPSAFREQPDWEPWQAVFEPLNHARSQAMTIAFTDEQVRIVDFPATAVATVEHVGSPASVGDTVRRFVEWRRQAKLPPRTSATFNIFHTDPASVPAGEYRMDICATTTRDVEKNSFGVAGGLIPGGRCAVLRLHGSSDNLEAGFRYLYSEWLPRSAEELRDYPPFVQRISFFPEVTENEAVTDLFLPLS